MSLIWGILMLGFGGVGAYMTGQYIEEDWYYTYAAPLTDHEKSVLTFLTICIIIAAVGLIMTIFAVWKKRNEDNLQKLTNTTSGGLQRNVCPYCGLNLANGTDICPKCANIIKTKQE